MSGFRFRLSRHRLPGEPRAGLRRRADLGISPEFRPRGEPHMLRVEFRRQLSEARLGRPRPAPGVPRPGTSGSSRRTCACSEGLSCRTVQRAGWRVRAPLTQRTALQGRPRRCLGGTGLWLPGPAGWGDHEAVQALRYAGLLARQVVAALAAGLSVPRCIQPPIQFGLDEGRVVEQPNDLAPHEGIQLILPDGAVRADGAVRVGTWRVPRLVQFADSDQPSVLGRRGDGPVSSGRPHYWTGIGAGPPPLAARS